MQRISLLLLLAGIAAAQDQSPFNKPPADMDVALRARIKEFYDYHVAGEFRKADALVAEDTKDYFFTSRKPQYISCEISRIDYFEKFTKAKAVIMCLMYVPMPGFNDKPVQMPTPSAWKIENGKWFWYVDQKEVRNTPFGVMTPGPAIRAVQPGASAAGGAAGLDMTTDFLFKQVRFEKTEVELWAGDSAEVLIANSAPGNMDLSVFSAPEGIDARLASATVKSNEKTSLKIKTSRDARPGKIEIRVDQTGQIIPLQIKFK